MKNRDTRFDTLSNFRDLGGITNKNGKKIKTHRLLRAGHLYKLPEDEQAILLDEYELCSVIDLRSDKELDQSPNVQLPGVTQTHIDIFKHNGDDAPSEENLTSYHESSGPDEHMLNMYQTMVLSPASQKGYRQFLETLAATENGATLWHCFAGKDRTGMTAMLLLHLLDVDREEIIKDYLRTVELRQKQNNEIIEKRRADGLSEEELENHAILLSVRDIYLERAFDVIEERYGSVDNYIFDTLGFPREGKEKLQELYLED